MPLRSINNTFTRGELDPDLYAREDIDIYTKGARRMRNMISLWTGASTIAPGSDYAGTIIDRENSNAPVTNSDYVKAIDFLYDSDNEIIFTIVLRQSNANSAIDIYENNSYSTTVTGAGYTNAQIKNVFFTASADRVLLLHEDVQIQQLRYDGTSWTLSDLTPSVFPSFDFSVIGEATNYRTSSYTFTLGATSGTGVSLSSSTAIFNAGHVGGLFIGNAGIARITAVSSTTAATVDIIEDFVSTTVKGINASLSEVMWGDSSSGSPAGNNRGWPARGVFYNDRLILGRTPVLKNVTAISTAGVYDNFDDAEADPTASFSVSFNGKGLQSLQSFIADDSIIFLTSNKVFAQSPLVETPLNINNAYFAPQTQSPASNIEGVSIDNQILYVSANRSQVLQLAYRTDEAKYLGFPATLVSNHLIDTINSNATWIPDNIPARLYFASQEDGTILMLSTLIEQNVSAWSLRTTRGDYKQVIGEGRQMSSIVERQINLGTSTFETNLDYAYNSDSTLKAFDEITTELSSASGSNVTVFVDENDYLVLGDDIPFTALNVTLNTVASDDCGLTFEYLDNNNSWNSFTPTDNTTGFTSSNDITWNFSDVLNWYPSELNKVESKYWIRIQRTTELLSTSPVVEEIQVNTGNRLYLEKFNFNRYTDSTISVTSDSSGNVTGLDHLAGQQVYAIYDGATYGPYFVDSSGETTIKPQSKTVNIGIQYIPELVPMPIYAPTQEGDNTYTQKYVQDLFIDYVDSLYLRAGTEERLTDIPNMKLNDYTLGQSVSPQTDYFKLNPRGNWQPRQEIKVTQSQPGPMTIIGIGYHVEIT